MKILMLSRLYLPHIGGVELHIQKLIAHADKSDHFTIITERHDSSLPEYETQDGIEIYRIPMGTSKKISVWLWMAKHLNLLWSTDVIHIHDVFFWLIPFLPVLLHKRLTITFHGYEGNENPNSRQIFWHQVAGFFTQANLCIGGFHEKWYGVRPTETSFGAVDERFLRASTKRMKGEITRFLYVGRLSADTGIFSYLQGLADLPTTYQKRWRLDVYGDGPDWERAEKFAKHNKLPVKFYGFVHPEQIRWSDFDIALVSRYLSILEALAVGLPVIAEANTEIKMDYLSLAPFSPWINIVASADQMREELQTSFKKSGQDTIDVRTQAQIWARSQTWDLMYLKYKKLWQS